MNIPVYFSPNNSISFGMAEIVQELPSPGEIFQGHVVKAVEPQFYDCEQPNPEVYQYAIWAVSFDDTSIGQLIAIHEIEAEKI